jgi:hypothetical protein
VAVSIRVLHEVSRVSDERIDPETLAEFLEGRLAPAERERVMRTLAESPEAYGDFIEAAAVERALAEETAQLKTEGASAATPAVIPISTKANRMWRYAVPALIAAGIVAVFALRRGGEARQGEMIVLAQATHVLPAGSGSVASKLGDSWDQPQWSVSRGADDASAGRARAFRAGARVAELEIAAQAGDTAAVRRIATSLATLLTAAQVGTPTVSQLRDFSAPSAATRAAVAGQIRDLLGAPANFDAGVWTETARLSLAAGNGGYVDATNAQLTKLILDLGGGASTNPNASLVSALQAIASAQATSPNDALLLRRLVDIAITTGAQ